ncbi:gamma-glutamylcyclotransferase family protein [Faucicola mancuniensis]|uniref:gamma-glutamylcyclotransferase family protein n=1 Tax=Faucicola mancuniensis TaxID=1309795 RepID=UPI0039775F43
MPKLFSYGTLQQENVQLATFGRLLDGQQDSLVGYVLGEIEITDPDVLQKSGKRFHPMLIKTDNADDKVAGVIFDINDNELLQADSYEVDAYKRIEAKFASGQVAWIYADASKN